MTCTHLADARHPGDEQLAEELVLHRHLGEEEVDLVVFALHPVLPFVDHVCVNETWLCSRREGRRRNAFRISNLFFYISNCTVNQTFFLPELTVEPGCGVLCPQHRLNWRVSGNNWFAAQEVERSPGVELSV